MEAGEISLRKAAETVRHDADPVPLDPKDLAARAEANTAKALKTDRRIDRRDVRVVYRRLNEVDRGQFIAVVITIAYMVARLATALDSERRQVADAAFNVLRSNDERLRHDEVVRAWIDEYEHSERA
jgi:hypothetical protein